VESNCYKKYPELKPKNKANKPSSKKSKKKSNKEDFKDFSNKDNNKAESSKVIINILSNNQTIEDNISFINYFSKSNDFKNKLVLDLSVTEHYTPNKDWLLDYKEAYNKSITVANSEKMAIKGIGDILVFINNKEVLIKNVNYVPNIKTTLISSNELTKKGWLILFKDVKAIISYEETKL
jgi:hypothetical protein